MACPTGKKIQTYREAKFTKKRMAEKQPLWLASKLRVYHCKHCGMFHVGHKWKIGR